MCTDDVPSDELFQTLKSSSLKIAVRNVVS